MANIFEHIYAAFSPEVAVNSDGRLVYADGLFDSGSDSVDYYLMDEYVPRGGAHAGGHSFTEPSDTSFSDITYADEFLEKYQEAVDNQNTAAQNSADRAMEFEEEQAQLNRDFQAAQAQKAMDYQTEMSNTAYQRAMDDLRKAGLNPKLVAQLGGASTPSSVVGSGSKASGHAASMSMANISALGGLLETYITSASALDRQNNGFVQDLISSLFTVSLLANL